MSVTPKDEGFPSPAWAGDGQGGSPREQQPEAAMGGHCAA